MKYFVAATLSPWNYISVIKYTNEVNALSELILTLTKLNKPPCILGTVKMGSLSWSVNSIDPGETARICMLQWLYAGNFRFRHV